MKRNLKTKLKIWLLGWAEYVLAKKMNPTAKRHLWADKILNYFDGVD